MCVIFFAYQKHSAYPLRLLANRDEFYNRPTEPAKNWDDYPDIFGGRDLIGGGTWLGINRSGKIAAVTNYRDPNAPTSSRSRGDLTAEFLKTRDSAEEYLAKIHQYASDFAGFNLLLGEINSERNELFYYSNRIGKIQRLGSGIYGLSNHLLDTPWRKVEKGKQFLMENAAQGFSKEDCFAVLADETFAEDEDLPDTGIGYEREKLLSAIFIKTPVYGTRCSTVLTVNNDFEFEFEERVFV